MLKKLKSISKVQIFAVVLVVVGLAMTVRYAIGTFNAYRDMTYARDHGFDTGQGNPDDLRPWMTMEYIGVAFAVPQEYLLADLGLPVEPYISKTPIDKLNDRLQLGKHSEKGYPLILERLKQLILDYRANPVSTGLREGGVRSWMSVQYIANSTGIPAEYIFEQIGIPMEGNAYYLLDRLADEQKYPGGLRDLIRDIQQIVDNYEETP